MTGRRLLLGVVATLALAAGASLPAAGAGTSTQASRATVHTSQTGALNATIRRTAGGIPHIESSTLAGAAYGYGYAFAQDNICVMAEDYVTVDAQRSRYFGPDGSYLQRGNGISANNLNSDFFFQQIIDSGIIDKLLATPPPVGPKEELKQGVHGYVEGYNRYLQDVGGANGISDPTCKGKPWVHPITDAEAYRRLYQLILLASGDVAIDGIGEAKPPTPALSLGGGGGANALDPQGIAEGLSKKLPIKSAGS